MIRAIASTLICAGLAAPAAAQTQATLPKEGPIDLTLIGQSTIQSVVLDKEFAHVTYDAYGSALAAKEGGFGDRVTARCLGSIQLLKGKFDAEIGSCRFVDRGGDTFFSRYAAQAADMPGAVVLKGSYVGGTGKFTGLTGSYEITRQALPSPGEGRAASVSFAKGTYKLP